MSIVLDGSNLTTTGVPNSGTAKTATGTTVDFTGIPAGTKRVTVMFSGVSTNGTQPLFVQIGSGSISTTTYVSGVLAAQSGSSSSPALNTTNGFAVVTANAAAYAYYGVVYLLNVSGNIWMESGSLTDGTGNRANSSGGQITLAGSLDRLRITTSTGVDTFDAGSINILYE